SMIIAQGARGLLRMYTDGQGWKYVLFVGLACYLCDAGAWLFGSLFGRHKMIPRISPNKTWEGAAGGYLCGILGSALFAYFAHIDLPFRLIVLCCAVLPPVSMVGDLAFSIFKRYYGIKDYSNLLPGHGGVLDRIDSLLFCLMVFNGLMALRGIL
ncbi:MAG: phosphatidate cytidylyltransferase, partial [Solobacterium sp.]|nr:phosphatidate cytidylyltransferase [Solobacterium sp.]